MDELSKAFLRATVEAERLRQTLDELQKHEQSRRDVEQKRKELRRKGR